MMGDASSCDENGLKKGPWTVEEDRKLVEYIEKNGHGSWRNLPELAGLNRCGKSCRLRWTNYLRPDIKRGKFSDEEEQIIVNLHGVLGNKWSAIAGHLPGRTDNEIKNFWNTHLKKKLLRMGIDPITHKPRTDLSILAHFQHLQYPTNNLLESVTRLQSDATQLAKFQFLQNVLQALTSSPLPKLDLLDPFSGLSQFSQLQREEFLNMNRSKLDHEETGNFQSGFSSQTPSQNLSYFNRFEPTQKLFLDDFSNGFGLHSSLHQLPTLISVSPENPRANTLENKINGKEHMIVSDDPLSSATFEPDWNTDEATESYWREIMDQTSPDQTWDSIS